MRQSRALPLTFAIACLTLAVLIGGDTLAVAQSVEDTEEDMLQARQQADVATGLVDAAVAQRSEIESQLATSIATISDLAAELSLVSASLDRLQGQIGYADAEMSGIESDLEAHAVDAYMTAVGAPGVTFVDSDSAEEAMVAGVVLGDAVSAGNEKIQQLVVKRRGLQKLQSDYMTQQEQVARLKAAVDAEVENLARLYAEADAEVAAAIRDARDADATYRAALGAVDTARAREAERRRQEERDTTTTTPPSTTIGGSSTTTTTPTTTTTGGGSDWSFPPAVEQWRDEASRYFPANRVDEALAVLQCESLGDPDAYNPYTGASGLFQFLPPTWASTAPKAGFPDASPFDPVANIGTAAWLANRYEELGLGFWQAWACRRVVG